MNFLEKLDPKYLGTKLLEHYEDKSITHKGYVAAIAGETSLGLYTGFNLGYLGSNELLSLTDIDPLISNTIQISSAISLSAIYTYSIIKRSRMTDFIAYKLLKDFKNKMILEKYR